MNRQGDFLIHQSPGDLEDTEHVVPVGCVSHSSLGRYQSWIVNCHFYACSHEILAETVATTLADSDWKQVTNGLGAGRLGKDLNHGV